MTEIVTLKAKTADALASMINMYFMRLTGREAKIISICFDGKQFVAFINVDIERPGSKALAE